MKAKTIITILFLAIANLALAQKEPISYEWFEKQSKIISNLQYKANGQNGRVYAQDNFTINYSDQLASWSWRHTVNGIEYLHIAEDIDFSKVIGLDNTDNIVHVTFADYSITEQMYGGKENQLLKSSLLDFYSNSEADCAKMLSELYHIITELKVAKGLVTRADMVNQWKDYKALKAYEFYQKHPKSVLAYEGKLLEEDYNKQAKFLQEFLKKYNNGVSWGTTIEDAIPYDKSIKKLFKIKKRKIDRARLAEKDYFKNTTPFASSFNAITEYYFGELSRIKDIDYIVLVTKNESEAKQKLNELKTELLDNFDNHLQNKKPETDNHRNYKFLHEVNLVKETKFGKKFPENSTYGYENIWLNINSWSYKKEVWYSVVVSLTSSKTPGVRRYDWIDY